MKNKITNPFITSGYIGPEYFCNRTEESKKLLGAISSRRNLTLISLRRMGKTGLLKHVKYLSEHQRNKYSVIYADLLPTMNGNEMLNSISSALVKMKKNEKGFFSKILSVLSSLRPKLTYDSLTGQPAIELSIESASDVQSGFNSILQLTSEIKQDLVFMFDEFQQISHYSEQSVEAILRSQIQQISNATFIYSGSQKHMLMSMFGEHQRPFYQSTEFLNLEKINSSTYKKFIIEKFTKGNYFIQPEAVDLILDLTDNYTWYVQYLCNKIYSSGNKKIDNDTVVNTLLNILKEQEVIFYNYRNLLTEHQFELLKAIASEKQVLMPTSKDFIQKYNLSAASTIKSNMDSLINKEMVFSDQDGYKVYDVFFSQWLKRF